MSYSSRVDTDKDNIYVNISIPAIFPNYNPTGPGIPNVTIPPSGEGDTQAIYKVNKTSPIIMDPSKYYCAITRFVVPLQQVPLFIMPIVPNTYVNPGNPGDPNLSTLVLGINYNGNDYASYVNYIPNSPNWFPPPIQNNITQVITPYYYVYTYSELMDMLNQTLITLWANSGLAGSYPNLSPPRFFFEPESQLIRITVPFIFVRSPIASIFYNVSALRFLDNYPAIYFGQNQPNGKDFQFKFYDQIENYYPPATIANPPLPSYYTYLQDYKLLYYYASLRKLLFVSQTLPIANEIVTYKNNVSEYSTLPVITDFVLDSNIAGESRGIAVYNPTAQYRLVDLSGNSPISSVDIQIYWVDQYDNIYPINIIPGQVASLKLGFFRKELYKNDIKK